MSLLPYNKIRHVTLTLDPLKFKPDLDTYRYIVKQVSIFIKNLKRKKINIIRYIKVIEFHRSGLPHFHLLIQTSDGQKIGKNLIQSVWGYGNCWERYFKNGREYKEFSGYFNKHGYLETGKEHQTELPLYLKQSTEVVRKFNYSFNFEQKQVSVEEKKEKKDNPSNKTRCHYTNEVRLSQCGQKTKVEGILYGDKWQDTCIIDIPYKQFISIFANEDVELREGVGLIIKVDKYLFYSILQQYQNNADIFIVDRIKEGYLKYSEIERCIEYLKNI